MKATNIKIVNYIKGSLNPYIMDKLYCTIGLVRGGVRDSAPSLAAEMAGNYTW